MKTYTIEQFKIYLISLPRESGNPQKIAINLSEKNIDNSLLGFKLLKAEQSRLYSNKEENQDLKDKIDFKTHKIPKIEEFIEGFEFQIKDTKDWKNEIYQDNPLLLAVIKIALERGDIRVKIP